MDQLVRDVFRGEAPDGALVAKHPKHVGDGLYRAPFCWEAPWSGTCLMVTAYHPRRAATARLRPPHASAVRDGNRDFTNSVTLSCTPVWTDAGSPC